MVDLKSIWGRPAENSFPAFSRKIGSSKIVKTSHLRERIQKIAHSGEDLDSFSEMAGDEGFTTHQSNCFHNLLSGPSRRWSNMTNKAPTVRIPRRAKQFALRSTPKKNHPAMGGFSLAGDEGFEPPITGPEPVALPLGQSPIYD